MKIGVRMKKNVADGWEQIEKAVGHKYLRRIPKPTGKGWYYIYKETFQRPAKALASFFGLTEDKIKNDYENNDIKKKYNVNKQTFAAHVLEYFSNRLKWENFFSRKETRVALKKPVKQKELSGESEERLGEEKQKDLFAEKKNKKNENLINRSLMRKVWSMYSATGQQIEQEEKDVASAGNTNDTKNKEANNERDSARVGRPGLSGDSGNIRSGEGKGNSNSNVPKTGAGDNRGESIQQSGEFGIGSGIGEAAWLGGTGRVTKGQARSIRKQCREILEKTNSEITEEDKAILRQYEGAGGLKEGDQSDVAVLSEFYTPRDVIGKMWELVDKYIPGPKNILEPSSGIGRFAENRNGDSFTLCELDDTSSRIASILHPGADVRPGAFQKMFMENNSITGYRGEKFDVAIGNPPYGEYTGLYKGLGEGKAHSRYEEYFIDRSLDTLKEGGILAFIVPSGFLRGKDSKAKQIIAEKGKLLEAWRLPKGTFSSTDVGTDILIIKKEKGHIKDYTDNSYFSENENHVIGYETDGGNWGAKIINLPEGKTVDEAVQMIDVNAVNAIQEVKEAARKIEVKEDEGIKKRYTITGNIEVGAEVIAEDGAIGKITMMTEGGSIAYSFKDGRAGRLPISSFNVISDKKTEAEISQKLSEAMKGNKNAVKTFRKTVRKKAREGDIFQPSIGKNQTAEEFNTRYSKSVPQEDMQFWRVTNWEGKVETSRLTQDQVEKLEKNKNFIKNENGDWVNLANYASGNIYNKLANLEQNKNNLSEEHYEKNKAALEAVLPSRRKIDNFTVSPIANFARLHKDENGASLVDRFLEWGRFGRNGYSDSYDSPITDSMLEDGITRRDIWAYITQEPVRAERTYGYESKEYKAMLREKKVQGRRESAERIFNDWIKNLGKEEIKHIEDEWNAQFNSIVNPDASKIPLFVDGMNTHKGKKEFIMTEQQVKGAARLCNKGNGILAYDVGVGKTAVGIVATISQMQAGRAKKPLVCVPKAVYKKWIKEIKQLFPETKINELHNLNKKVQEEIKNKNGEIELQEGYLNVCTYEALQKITFKQETLDGALRDDILESQTVYDYDESGRLIADKRSDRQKAQANEKMMGMLGMSAKAKKDAVFWEDLGFDHITVDELHNFKNIFMVPRTYGSSVRDSSDGKTGSVANEYSGIAGATSASGMKMFAISQLIQRENNGEGFFGLTATPFNNSPVEIYNILSLLARNRLKELKIYNLQDFLREYAEMKPDWKVDARGDVSVAQVMKNFKNLGALQSLITEFIDKVDGEEAGVIRPYKRVHVPMLDLTPLQRAIIAAETDRMDGKFRKAGDDSTTADMFIALNNMRMATLSPSLVNEKYFQDYVSYEGWRTPKLKDIVKESPKLQFVCDTATALFKERPKEGQLIYMPRGVDQYAHVKSYLVEKGVPEDAIAFMNSSTTLDQKEVIKNDFNNPDGKIKIIIGSETIKEGVSLNGNSITTYNTMLGWNPTEVTQVDGRVHRQGNRQGVVHSIFPLMNDSIDAMMYQKYDEKSSRLNALWSYKGDSLNVEDIDPEEMKYALIKDPAKRANMKILKDQADLKKEKKLNNALYDNLSISGKTYRERQRIIDGLTLKENVEYYEGLKKEKEEDVKHYQKEFKKIKDGYEEWKKENAGVPKWRDPLAEAERNIEQAKNSLERIRSQIRANDREIRTARRDIERVKTIWERYGITDEDGLDKKLSDISESSASIEEKIKEIENSREQLVEEARRQIAEEQARIKSHSVQDRVSAYSKEILSDLRPFSDVRNGIKLLRKYSKKQIEDIISAIKENGSIAVGGDLFTNRDIKELTRFKEKAVLEKSFVVARNNRIFFVSKHFKKTAI